MSISGRKRTGRSAECEAGNPPFVRHSVIGWFRPISAAKSPIGRSRNRTFSTTLARRLRSHWRALLTLHAFAVPKAWRSFQNQTLAEVAGTSTDQCKSLPVV
jgi:hypothetical protein